MANDKCQALPGCQKSIILVTRSICQPWPNHHLQPPPRPLAIDMKMSFNLQSLQKLGCLHKMFYRAWHFLFIYLLLFHPHLIDYFSFVDYTFNNSFVALCHNFNIKTFPFLLNKHTICLAGHYLMSVFIGLGLAGVYPSKWLLPPIMFTVNSSHLTRQSIKCVKWVFMYGWIVAKEWWITPLTGKIQVSFDRICNIKVFEVHVSNGKLILFTPNILFTPSQNLLPL